MAFAEASGPFTFNHSTFIDNSNITKNASSNEKNSNGEGLQLLLNASSTEASFDSQARHPPPLCHPSTRTGLLDYIFQWIDAGEENILFLDGPAGAGKSAVAQTVAASCKAKEILEASFFFFRGSPSRNTIAPLVPTIAYQMGSSTARKRKKMRKVIKADPSILHKSPEVQLRKLILELFRPSLFRCMLFKFTKQKRHLLIVDGLDECNNENDQLMVVMLLGQFVNNTSLRCLITSRPEPHIISAVTLLPGVARVTLNEQSWNATGDVRTYLRSGFDKISSQMNIPQPWPSDDVIDTLVARAGGIFIYASTVLKYIGDHDALPTKQLEHVLQLSPGTTPFAELDQLYRQILMACPLQHRATLLHIFGFIFLRNPSFEEDFGDSLIEALLGLSQGEVAIVLRKMHSILIIRTSGTKRTINFLHASFGDFIFNRERSGPFFIDRLKESLFLAGKCIDCIGHREQRGLHGQIKLMGDAQIVYAWSSWFYHGKGAGDSYFMDFVEKLRCDKTSWSEVIPNSYHHYCMDKLEDGIAWVKSLRGKSTVDVLISELTSVRQRLLHNHINTVLINPGNPLFIRCVFEDPVIGFSTLNEHVVTIRAIQRGDGTSEILCFQRHGKSHDLAETLIADVLAGVPSHPSSMETSSRHGTMAVHCIHILKNTNYWLVTHFQYAAKYWAKHLSLSGIDYNVLEGLRQFRPWKTLTAQQVICTVADAFLVIQWLKLVSASSSHQASQLLGLWGDYCRKLQRKGCYGESPIHQTLAW